jgi:hypothetical protein
MTTNRASVVATAPAETGEAASTVRNIPLATQGWRPTSVTVQPARMAMKPSGHDAAAARRNHGEDSSRPRHHSQQPQTATR